MHKLSKELIENFSIGFKCNIIGPSVASQPAVWFTSILGFLIRLNEELVKNSLSCSKMTQLCSLILVLPAVDGVT
jgi:hypothetical protein